MGTEHADTERMHRLLGDALTEVDLSADVVPAVLTGYGHRVKVRRYQAAGVALAVLATAGAAISVLPRNGVGRESTAVAPASQEPDHCQHQRWSVVPVPHVGADARESDPGPDQANCEALTTALRAVVPQAGLVPDYVPDLTLDTRLDQALVKRVSDEKKSGSPQGQADEIKYFGAELKYLAVHPDDPANVYNPIGYTLVTAAGREHLGIILGPGKSTPGYPASFVGSIDSNDCKNMPAALAGKAECTPVGTADGWHGALWKDSYMITTGWASAAVVTDKQGKSIQFLATGYDGEAWYQESEYEGFQSPQSTTWVNRWTGQTSSAANPPASHALTQQQWAVFFTSPAFQKYADSYAAYAGKLPTQAAPTH